MYITQFRQDKLYFSVFDLMEGIFQIYKLYTVVTCSNQFYCLLSNKTKRNTRPPSTEQISTNEILKSLKSYSQLDNRPRNRKSFGELY